MRIAHIAPSSKSEISAAWRIRTAQRFFGIDAVSFVHFGNSSEFIKLIRSNAIFAKFFNKLFAILDLIPIRICFKRDKSLPLSAGWIGSNVSSKLVKLNVDVVNVHWITNGCLNIRNLAKINKPIVITMHDVWPLTGGCHCNLGCEKWVDGCMDCPQLGVSFFGNQVAHNLWLYKLNAFKKIPSLTIVTPSRWLADMVKSSPFFTGRDVELIPNCLDLTVFCPKDKIQAKINLGFPVDKKVILFGAVNATNVSYKGYDLLIEALGKLKKISNQNYHLVVFGSSGDERTLPYPTSFLGDLNFESDIAEVFQAADVFVTTSKQDNFPSTVLESLSCGTPIVAFNVGGIPEMIEHKKNGYIAKCFDVNDFATGIEWILNRADSKFMNKSARDKAYSEFSPTIIAKKYSDLYKKISCNKDSCK